MYDPAEQPDFHWAFIMAGASAPVWLAAVALEGGGL